ncbi:hypothetical protein PBOI14_21720 [Pseudomonas sp. Boi14]|nr:hypothetical protein PBOI14_21720 [Pseudomonas sp. Boi14]
MGHCRPWKALRIHRRLCLCLLVLGMLLGSPLWAADVLLTASDDNSSVRTFTEELAAQRPGTRCASSPWPNCRRRASCPAARA